MAGQWAQIDSTGRCKLDSTGRARLVTVQGTPCCCAATALYAPIRKCSDGSILYADPPTNSIPYKNGCTTTGDGITYYWSNYFQACLYWDCSEATASALEDGWFLGPGINAYLTDCTDPICDYDNDGNPDPPGPGPTETFDATDCGCDADFAQAVTASLAGITACSCVENVNFVTWGSLNQSLTLGWIGGCSWRGVFKTTMSTCGVGAATFEARITVTAFLNDPGAGPQWTATATGEFYNPGAGVWTGSGIDSVFTCATATGNCLGATMSNELTTCANAGHGGTLTIAAAVLP